MSIQLIMALVRHGRPDYIFGTSEGRLYVPVPTGYLIRNNYPHSTDILRKYYRNIPWKYCKIAKIFQNLSLILLKYCNNLAMSAQNMTYAIFYKYCQN